jgi:uncharacterized damage-inducible protein DinB
MEHTEIESLVERLAAAPGRIAAAAAGLSPEQLSTPPADGEWSARAVLAHIRACDDILSPRLIAMVVRDEPTMPLFDDRRWEEVMGYADADFQELLAAYTFRRAELVRALRRVSPADWQRTGQLEARGQAGMQDVLRMIVRHEDEHCLQIETALGSA